MYKITTISFSLLLTCLLWSQSVSEIYPVNPGDPLPANPTKIVSSPVLLPAPAVSISVPESLDKIVTPAALATKPNLETGVPAVIANPAPDTLKNPLTLEQVLQTAFRYNPDIQIALANVQAGRGKVNEALAYFNPNFDASLSAIVQGPTSPDTYTTLGVSFLLPLDISKRIQYAKELADYSFQMNYLAMVSTSENVILNVKTAYYNLLRACEQEKVAQSAVDVSASRLANTQARRRAGTVAQFDVTAGETELANLKQQLISTQNRVKIAQSNLNAAMGVDISYPSQVVREAQPIDIANIDIAQAIQTAYAQRPDIKSTQLAVAVGAKSVELEKSALRPSVGVSGSAKYNTDPMYTSDKTSWSAVLGVSMPIWDGGVTKAKVEQAQAKTISAIKSLDQMKLKVSQDVRVAALNLQEAALRSQTTAQAVSLAQEALRLANVRYESGIAVSVEVTNAESQLTQAKSNQVNAEYDYAVALAQLQRAQSAQPELNNLQLLVGNSLNESAKNGEQR